MECLLHHDRVIALELMSIVGNIAKANDRVVRIPEGMEHGRRAIGWLSCVECVLRIWMYAFQRQKVNDLSIP
jgi:hypothetical protein